MIGKGLPVIYQIGSIGEFMKWTKRVITDPAAASGTPKRWFDSEEPAAKALGAPASQPDGIEAES
jgi:hypothetical protein